MIRTAYMTMLVLDATAMKPRSALKVQQEYRRRRRLARRERRARRRLPRSKKPEAEGLLSGADTTPGASLLPPLLVDDSMDPATLKGIINHYLESDAQAKFLEGKRGHWYKITPPGDNTKPFILMGSFHSVPRQGNCIPKFYESLGEQVVEMIKAEGIEYFYTERSDVPLMPKKAWGCNSATGVEIVPGMESILWDVSDLQSHVENKDYKSLVAHIMKRGVNTTSKMMNFRDWVPSHQAFY